MILVILKVLQSISLSIKTCMILVPFTTLCDSIISISLLMWISYLNFQATVPSVFV